MYGIDGRRDLTESTLDHLSGYDGARPVRIGNGAFDQRQNDVYGAVLDAILLHTAAQPAPAAAAVADRAGPGRVRHRRVGRARPGHLGGAGQAAALRVVEADVLGRARPAPRSWPSSAATATCAATWRATADEIRADILDHGVSERGRAAPALRHRRARRVDAAGADLRVPARRRRAGPQHRARHRRRAHRERLRAALPHRRDRRRPVGQGGHVPHLLVLAGVGAVDHRRARSGPATCSSGCCASPRRSGSTPRSSTSTPATTSATSRRRSPTSP